MRRRTIISILFLSLILSGCQKETYAVQEYQFNIIAIDGEQIFGKTITSPVVNVSIGGTGEGYWETAVSFIEENTTIYDYVKTGNRISIPIQSESLKNGSPLEVEVVIREYGNVEVSHREWVHIAQKTITPVIYYAELISDSRRTDIMNGDEIELKEGEKGEIAISCNHPEILNTIVPDGTDDNTALVFSRTYPVHYGTFESVMHFYVDEPHGNGSIWFTLPDSSTPCFAFKYCVGTKPTNTEDPLPVDNETPISFNLKTPDIVFANKPFRVYIEDIEVNSDIPRLNAEVFIDGEAIPAGVTDDDWYKFNYVYEDIAANNHSLLVSSHSVQKGHHTLEVLLWPAGEGKNRAVKKMASFYAAEVIPQ